MPPKASAKTEQKAKAKTVEDKTCASTERPHSGPATRRLSVAYYLNAVISFLCLRDPLLLGPVAVFLGSHPVGPAVGLKNKNKSAKVAKYVQQVQQQVSQMGNRKDLVG